MPAADPRAALGVPLPDGADALGVPDDEPEPEDDAELEAVDDGKESVTLELAMAQNRWASCSADAVSVAQLATAQLYMVFANRVLLLESWRREVREREQAEEKA